MRGRLIFPFHVHIARLDTLATGIDPDFREPRKLPPASGQGTGVTNRVELATIIVPMQIEPGEFMKLQMFFNGNSPDSKLVAVAHFSWLERNDLVDATGNAKIQIGDRLVDIYDRGGNRVMHIRDPLFVTQVQPTGFGIGRSRNLLVVYFEARSAGATS